VNVWQNWRMPKYVQSTPRPPGRASEVIELFGITPLRADILRHLSMHQDGATSGDIGRALAANYRTVARHLALLEESGVVESDATKERQGVRVLYRINPEKLSLAAKLLLRYLHGE
jgi:DNA-binding transcriptional ArsR family regulator